MTDCVIRIQNKAKLLSVNSWWPLNRGELIGTAERSTRALNRGLIYNILDLFYNCEFTSVNSWWPLNRGELIGTAERSTRMLNRGLISNILDLFYNGDLI